MNIAIRPTSFMACLALVALIVGTSIAQQTNGPQTRVANPRSSSGARIAVIDVNHIFKNHLGFKQSVEAWKQRVKNAETKMKGKNQLIEQQVEQLRIYKPGTKEFKNLEEQVAKERADLQVEVQINKKELMLAEAKMYLSVYQQLKEQVAYFARQHNITLVMRYNSGDVDPEDPRQIQSLMLRPVLFQDRIDITNDLLNRLNGSAQVGRRPTAPGSPAAQVGRRPATPGSATPRLK